MKPYGPQYIENKEIVGHVQKIKYSSLMKRKSVIKNQVLSDGETIGGSNRLSKPIVNTHPHC